MPVGGALTKQYGMLTTWPHIFQKISQALSPSGGISYHYLALKYQKKLWAPHAAELDRHLKQWSPLGPDLILFGASGGYSLPAHFLRRFQNISIYDPDPLAEIIFKRRFPDVAHRWFQHSLIFNELKRSKEDLITLRTRHAEAAILFCNSLGQWPIVNPSVSEADIASFVQLLNQEFANTGWASYHDIFSGSVTTSPSQVSETPTFSCRQNVEDWWRHHGGKNVVDHLTFEAFQGANRKHWHWSLTPTQIQIIEWAQGPLRPSKSEPFPQGAT